VQIWPPDYSNLKRYCLAKESANLGVIPLVIKCFLVLSIVEIPVINGLYTYSILSNAIPLNPYLSYIISTVFSLITLVAFLNDSNKTGVSFVLSLSSSSKIAKNYLELERSFKYKTVLSLANSNKSLICLVLSRSNLRSL